MSVAEFVFPAVLSEALHLLPDPCSGSECQGLALPPSTTSPVSTALAGVLEASMVSLEAPSARKHSLILVKACHQSLQGRPEGSPDNGQVDVCKFFSALTYALLREVREMTARRLWN